MMASTQLSLEGISGSMVALVTPMTPNGELDIPAYKALIDWHIAEGTDALVVVGTTGESPTMTMAENKDLIGIAVQHTNGRIPVVAGAGANSTAEAIELSRQAAEFGADAILSVVPYYNKPSQEGLYQHFKAVAESVSIPVILYNVPGRTVADLQLETVLRLAEIPNILGIKDATGDIARGVQLINNLPRNFAVYSGDDPTAGALMLMGGKGNISVTANIAPKLMHELCAAALAGQHTHVQAINKQLADLNRALFLEANPIPVKWALAKMGRSQLGYRLPLVNLSEQYHDQVTKAMRSVGIAV